MTCLYSILLFIVFWYCHTLIFDLLPDFWFSSDTFIMQNNIKKIVFFWLIFSLLQEADSVISGLLMWILNHTLCTWFTLARPEEILHENHDASLPLTQKPRMHAILLNTACFSRLCIHDFCCLLNSRFLRISSVFSHGNCASIQFNFNFGKHPERLCDDAQKTEGSWAKWA